MKKKMLRGLLVKPGEAPVPFEIEHTLENIYQLLGCETIDICYPFSDSVALVVDDEGKLNRAKPNRVLRVPHSKLVEVSFNDLYRFLQEAKKRAGYIQTQSKSGVPMGYGVTAKNILSTKAAAERQGETLTACYIVEEELVAIDTIVGPFLVCWAPPESDDLESLPDSMMEKYSEVFGHLDRIIWVGDHLVEL